MRRLVYIAVAWLCASALAVADNGFSRAMERLSLNAPQSVARLYGPQPQAQWSRDHYQQLLEAVEASAADGLNPDDYHRRVLVAGGTSAAQRDVLASDAYLSLAAHLLTGKLDPVSIEVDWTAMGRQRDLVAHLQQALVRGNIAASLNELLPQQPRYHVLKAALQRYRQFDDSGNWPQLSDGPLLKPGTRSPRIKQLRARLQRSGDLPLNDESAEAELYGAGLVIALKRFQQRANLEPDGIVGPTTVRELNRRPRDRIDQLRVNLERWRWLPDDLGERHIRVNIADYQLEVHQGSDITAAHDVVVGRAYRQTPVFSAMMSYLVFNPWWETPAKLAKNDILPKFQAERWIA
jgi:murein L,D-transpeptidase YcbB/YkuD